ncbi:CocE/NonD family hydrolase [Actinocrispum sp. NPDC049592]|uniref:CocE/NonD family hydrolase n=1 Tax=Actinocrispum sp. NPDC049592 TaxID=3154835 RepID=UPI0034363594
MPARTHTDRHYEVTVVRDVRIPAGQSDMTLSADLFLPSAAGPVPVLVTVLPYRRDVAALTGSVTERWFAARGYASLLVDIRGTGSSDGAQRPPFDPGDAEDALAAIDWAAGQPWCDGKVGMWGHSYGAMTALRTASCRPAALKAIIAVQGLTDPARDFVHPGGSRGSFSPLGSWGLGNVFNQLLPPLDDYDDPAEQARWYRRLAAPPYLLDMYRHGPGSPVWAQREVDLEAVEVPALCVAGWRDLFGDATIRAYERISGRKRLIAGPWMHVMPQQCPFTPIDFLALARSWWDRWLGDVPNCAEMPPVSVYVQGANERWLEFPDWPPAGTTRLTDLSTWERSEPPEVDPAAGLRSGLWSTPAGLFGQPADQHDDDARSLCYTSLPLAEPLLLCGRPAVEVDHPWPRTSAKLTVVDPLGRSLLISPGLESTVRDRVRIGLNPTTYEVPAGHRLRVVLAPGDFPRVWPETTDPGGRPIARTLVLPVVAPHEGTEIEYPPPEDAIEDIGQEIAGQAVWETTTDLLNERVSLRVAGVTTVRPDETLPRRHVMTVEQDLVATADRLEPEASTVTGVITGTIDIDTGAHITVEVAITATPSALEATGRVTRDGETILDRHWRG